MCDFLGSGHVDTDDILQEGDGYTISRHQFLRALIFRDHEHFDPSASDVVNVFDVSSRDGKEHFVSLVVCAQLDSWARVRPGEGFVDVGELFDVIQDLGFVPEQVEYSVERLIATGLVESVEKGGRESGAPHERVRVTATGGYYLRTLSRMFTYVDAMIVDTPIVDEAYVALASSVSDIDERLSRAERFIEYLDAQWRALANRGCAFDWVDTSAALIADIQGIRQRPRRTRKHHF